MRGSDKLQNAMFSYVSLEDRIPADHPLREIRKMCDEALKCLSGRFSKLYSKLGRPSVPPEQLLRALLLQALYSVRSERSLMERLEYDLLFRWFVGLNMDGEVWDVTVFTKNRERLVKGNIAQAFFDAVVKQLREKGLLSDDHFTVDGTLLAAWASVKSYQKKENPPDEGSGSRGELLKRDLHEKAKEDRIPTRCCTKEEPDGDIATVSHGACADGESQRPAGSRVRDSGDNTGRMGSGCEDVAGSLQRQSVHGGSGYGIRHRAIRGCSAGDERDAACI